MRSLSAAVLTAAGCGGTAVDVAAELGRSVDSAFSGAIGDTNGDGCGDLVMRRVPGGVVEVPESHHGTLEVHYGGPDGLASGTGAEFTRDSGTVSGKAEDGDGFGWSTHLADFDGDDRADLAVGAPGENEGQGAVWTLRFTGEGVAGIGSYGPKVLGVSGPGSGVGDAFAD